MVDYYVYFEKSDIEDILKNKFFYSDVMPFLWFVYEKFHGSSSLWIDEWRWFKKKEDVIDFLIEKLSEGEGKLLLRFSLNDVIVKIRDEDIFESEAFRPFLRRVIEEALPYEFIPFYLFGEGEEVPDNYVPLEEFMKDVMKKELKQMEKFS